MSANLRRLLALIVWAGVVFVLVYWKWWPRRLDLGELHSNERAFILRLPQDGILTRLIGKDSVVTLAMPELPKPEPPKPEQKKQTPPKRQPPPPPAPPAQTPGQSGPAPPPIPVVEHARVLDKVCNVDIQSNTRIAMCYAVIAVPAAQMATLASAPDKVSVWIEGQAKHEEK